MTKEEIDCEDPENEDHPDCQCSYDEDAAYDSWADDRVIRYYEILKERQLLYKKLLLCSYSSNHNDERDELEKQLVYNLTRNKKNWVDMNSIHSDEW